MSTTTPMSLQRRRRPINPKSDRSVLFWLLRRMGISCQLELNGACLVEPDGDARWQIQSTIGIAAIKVNVFEDVQDPMNRGEGCYIASPSRSSIYVKMVPLSTDIYTEWIFREQYSFPQTRFCCFTPWAAVCVPTTQCLKRWTIESALFGVPKLLNWVGYYCHKNTDQVLSKPRRVSKLFIGFITCVFALVSKACV